MTLRDELAQLREMLGEAEDHMPKPLPATFDVRMQFTARPVRAGSSA